MAKRTILVIDDEPHIVEVVSKYLAHHKFNVLAAYSGKKALEIVRKAKKIDLIVLDEKMPSMTGGMFHKEMRKLKIDIPVIVLTGSINLSTISQYNRRYYKHILFKPARLSKLLELIENLI